MRRAADDVRGMSSKDQGLSVYLHNVQRASFIIGVLLLLGPLQAQDPPVLPDISGSWDMTTTTWNFDGTNMNFSYFDHHLAYDTAVTEVLNDTLWYAVFDGLNNQVGWLTIQANKVFFRSTALYDNGYGGYEDPATRLLYDFSLDLHDTAYFDSEMPEIPVTVEAKDTVYLGGLHGCA